MKSSSYFSYIPGVVTLETQTVETSLATYIHTHTCIYKTNTLILTLNQSGREFKEFIITLFTSRTGCLREQREKCV
uniref:Uncharacterized protein n=1 Tax=Arion vulgaris TaxID=1028688 RepID=A0A0B6XYB6_9EUPU